MHVISKEPFETAKKLYPNCTEAISETYTLLSRLKVSTPEELREVIPSLDNFKYVDKWYVIDIGGNDLRLIAFIEFKAGKCFIKHIVTHAEYDKITDFYRSKKGQQSRKRK